MRHQKVTKLFCLIPIFGWKEKNSCKVWKILGLPVLKSRKVSGDKTVKYYVFGIPFIKLSKKIK